MISIRYREVVDNLRAAYDGGVERRDRHDKPHWKLVERETFLRRLRDHGFNRLLEVGAGTGQDSKYFQDHGLGVVATDLSPAMVACCRAKGLDARVMDFLHLDLPPDSFDAIYALNCLLHVPNADLPLVLEALRSLLRPGGLFFLGVYGGSGSEGIADEDIHDPPRFFSWRTDEQIQESVCQCFELLDFHVVEYGEDRFQPLTRRRPE